MFKASYTRISRVWQHIAKFFMASLVEVVARQAHLTFSRSFTDETFNECLSKLKKFTGQIKATDLNLRRDSPSAASVRSLRSRAPVTYIEVACNPSFTMGIFVLRNGGRIPLHDHPQMYGVLKVIQGRVKITTFSCYPRDKSDISVPRDVKRKIRSSQMQSLLPVHKHTESYVSENDDESCVLTPTENNYHEICAVGGTAAFLDILAPPYDGKERDCHYYVPLESSAPDSDVKTWLLETCPPPDYWCDVEEYRGPKITL